MNVRTIFLMSMIFCAAPIVRAAPKVSLTEQAQEILLEHIDKSFEILPAKTQEAVKTAFSLLKDEFEFMLRHMRIGQSASEFEDKKSPLDNVELETLLGNLNCNKDEENACLGMVSMAIGYDFLTPEKSLWSEKVITKRHIAVTKKITADLSLMLKRWNAISNKSVKHVPNLNVQVQKIFVECINKLNKILRPEAQQLVKRVISLRQKKEEYILHTMLEQGKGHWSWWWSTPEWYKIGYNEIEIFKKKLRLSKDEQNVMSALHHCKRFFISLDCDQDLEEDLAPNIVEQKKTIKNLSSVLKCLSA